MKSISYNIGMSNADSDDLSRIQTDIENRYYMYHIFRRFESSNSERHYDLKSREASFNFTRLLRDRTNIYVFTTMEIEGEGWYPVKLA